MIKDFRKNVIWDDFWRSEKYDVKDYYQNGIDYRKIEALVGHLAMHDIDHYYLTSTTTTIEPNFYQQSIKNLLIKN
jgi:hypothetical protein